MLGKKIYIGYFQKLDNGKEVDVCVAVSTAGYASWDLQSVTRHDVVYIRDPLTGNYQYMVVTNGVGPRGLSNGVILNIEDYVRTGRLIRVTGELQIRDKFFQVTRDNMVYDMNSPSLDSCSSILLRNYYEKAGDFPKSLICTAGRCCIDASQPVSMYNIMDQWGISGHVWKLIRAVDPVEFESCNCRQLVMHCDVNPGTTSALLAADNSELAIVSLEATNAKYDAVGSFSFIEEYSSDAYDLQKIMANFHNLPESVLHVTGRTTVTISNLFEISYNLVLMHTGEKSYAIVGDISLCPRKSTDKILNWKFEKRANVISTGANALKLDGDDTFFNSAKYSESVTKEYYEKLMRISIGNILNRKSYRESVDKAFSAVMSKFCPGFALDGKNSGK